jgi:hypothetical protein
MRRKYASMKAHHVQSSFTESEESELAAHKNLERDRIQGSKQALEIKTSILFI